jgi:hypothetical protein
MKYRKKQAIWHHILFSSLVVLGTSFLITNLFYLHKNPKPYLFSKPDWRSVSSFLKDTIKKDDIIITDNPIAVYYYLGKSDYVIDENLLHVSMDAMNKNSEGRWLDNYAPAVHVTSIREITDLATSGHTIWILFGHPWSGFPKIKEYVRRNATPLSASLVNHGVELFRFN